MVLIEEERLEQAMQEEVEPFLEKFRTQGRLRGELYYELYPLPSAKGTLVFSHGSTESCVKFHEFIYYALQEGYSCAVMDHRGHGFSIREGKTPGVVHVTDFGLYAQDLHDFVHTAVLPAVASGPMYLYGHSMGGCIAADYLERWSEDFEKAVLNAPMLGLDMGKMPPWAGRLFTRLMCLLGKGEEKLFFQENFNPNKTFEDSCAASKARYDWYHGLRCSEPMLQMSASSYRWTLEAIRTSKKVLKEAGKITAPVLLFQAETDGLVSPKAQEEFVKRLKRGRLVKVANSRHEIYRSENSVLEDYFRQIFAFLKEEEQGGEK